MERILTFFIPNEYTGMRIDSFLRLEGFSGSVLNILRHDSSLVLLDGSEMRLVDTVIPEKTLQIRLPESEPPTNIEPENIPLHIIYEDPDILAIDKPPDMAVYPTPASPKGTLSAACRYYYRNDDSFVFRCINRLDRHTSGIVLIAKNRFAASVLTENLHTNRLVRTYIAAARGSCPDHGTIDAPIGRAPNSALAREVMPNGAKAVTHFKKLSYNNGYSLLEIKLDTGRTHQIRVHLKHIGHPIPGDFLYNPDYSVISRQALHSWKLNFYHPVTHNFIELTAPVPRDIINIFPTQIFDK